VHLNLLIQIWEKLPHPLALELLVDRAIQTGGLSYLKAHVPKSEHFNRIHEFINTRLERDKIEERRQIIVQEWTTIYDRIGGGIPRILSAGGAAVAYGQFINLYDQANNESGQLAVRLRAIANELNFINELIRDIQQLCLDVQRIIEQLNLQNQALEQQHIAFQRAKNGIQNLNRRLDNLGTIENANVDAQRTDARQNNLEALRQLVATLQQMLNTSTTNPDSYKDQLIQLQSQESVYTHEQGLLNQQYHKLNEENNRLSARIELLAQLSEPVQELVTEIGRNHHEKQRISEQLNELRRQWQQHVADEIPVQIDAVRCKRQKRNRAIREDVNRLNQLTNVQNVNIHRPPMGNKGF
jgi:chromosome segregation ATPase